MPWIAAVPAIAGAVGGIASAIGARKQRGNAFQQALWQYNPNRINNSAAALNPWLAQLFGMPNKYNAWRPSGNDAFMQDLRKIYSGQDISPYLLNQPLNQINQGQNQNLARVSSMLGRSGLSGGLANTYALANLAGGNNAKANLYQQYGQWREQQRRNDINNIFNLWGQSQNLAAGMNQQQAQMMPGPAQNSWQMWGGALPRLAQSGVDIYNAIRSPQPTSTIQMGSGGYTGGSGSFPN